MTTPVLTEDGKRLATVDEKAQAESFGRSCVGKPGDRQTTEDTAASLRLPLEGDASLREAVHPEIRAEFEGHCGNLIRVFASGADFTSAATALAQFALDNRSAFSAALARPQPEAKGPVAAGEERQGRTKLCFTYCGDGVCTCQSRELTQDESRLVMSALLSSAPEVVAEMSTDWKCPKCRCRTIAAVDERKPDGSFGPGDLLRCVNCKGVFFRASLAAPAEAKILGAATGGSVGDDRLRGALVQCAVDFATLHHGDCDMEHAEKHGAGLRMANAALASTTPPAEAKTPDAGVGEVVERMCRAFVGPAWEARSLEGRELYRARMQEVLEVVPRALTPTGSAGEDDTGVREHTRKAVARAMDEDGGWWKSCSGCHETNEGYETGHYPYSELFRCHVGSGCSECGGLGVVWEHYSEEDFAAMAAESLAPQPPKAETPAGVGEPAAWAYEFHEFGDVWKRHVILNRPDGGANPPTKHHGSKIRNVVALFTDQAAALSTAPAARPGDEVSCEAVEAASAAFYDAMIGPEEKFWPHHEGWAGKGEGFKARVRDRMRTALEAALAAAPAADGGRG